MDQNTILVLVAAAMLAQKPAPVCQRADLPKSVGLQDMRLDDPTKLLDGDKEMLGRLATFLRERNCTIVVQGFTDPGSKDPQDALRRATTVKAYLTEELPDSRRVRMNQVSAESKGVLAPGRYNPVVKIARVSL